MLFCFRISGKANEQESKIQETLIRVILLKNTLLLHVIEINY